MVSDSERKKILEMIETSTITAEEGLTLLNALSESGTADGTTMEPSLAGEPETIEKYSNKLPHETETFFHSENDVGEDVTERIEDVEVIPPRPTAPDSDEIKRWKRWWVIPLWVGAAITVIGGLLMFWAFSANGFGFWFACAWFPFLMGAGILALAWGSRTSPWLHVRVHQPPGEKPRKIAISFPIPIRLTAWGLRTFGHHIPHMENTNLDEVILALKDVAKDGTPLSVDVTEGDDGERVQVFIG